MGFYNVVAPCVVGQLHYARPHAEPIEVDDDTAAPLVESGELQPYGPGQQEAASRNDVEASDSDAKPEAPPARRPRTRRKD